MIFGVNLNYYYFWFALLVSIDTVSKIKTNAEAEGISGTQQPLNANIPQDIPYKVVIDIHEIIHLCLGIAISQIIAVLVNDQKNIHRASPH